MVRQNEMGLSHLVRQLSTAWLTNLPRCCDLKTVTGTGDGTRTRGMHAVHRDTKWGKAEALGDLRWPCYLDEVTAANCVARFFVEGGPTLTFLANRTLRYVVEDGWAASG